MIPAQWIEFLRGRFSEKELAAIAATDRDATRFTRVLARELARLDRQQGFLTYLFDEDPNAAEKAARRAARRAHQSYVDEFMRYLRDEDDPPTGATA